LIDNPLLTVRWAIGKNPTRIVYDPMYQLSERLNIFQTSKVTTLRYHHTENYSDTIQDIKVEKQDVIFQIVQDLYYKQIQSLIVEGGPKTHQLFVDAGLVDEIRVIKTPVVLNDGIRAIHIPSNFVCSDRYRIADDEHLLFTKSH
jgi:Pyrimidine reductase, riboflavin biosynthesis